MKVVDSIARMSTLARMTKKESKSVGLVPTMGYLHEGHLSLVTVARKHTDVVVMSIFVNPIQFGPNEDYSAYPRDFKRDEKMAFAAGVDVLFCPSVKEMYPEGFSTFVLVEGLSDALCGRTRPGHFKGVTTVVAKLFNIVKPDVAYFGQKDAQQAIIIKRMARDLNTGVDIKILPIVRDSYDLALSSRNINLSEAEREDARVLGRSLKQAEGLIRRGELDPKKVIGMMKDLISARPDARIDYISIVDTKNLRDAGKIEGEVLIAIAAFFGKTRLIDNIIVDPLAPEKTKSCSDRKRQPLR